MSDIDLRIAQLAIHPVKSCAALPQEQALVIETGFDLDRAWMVVDEHQRFVTQRELPRLALVRPTLRGDELVLRAPGMLALHLALDAAEKACRATVWNDEVAAYDMGDLAGQWFSDFLGTRLRLVRFDPEHKRPSDRRWTGDIAAENAFADAFPFLVASRAGLDELNRRLADTGHPPVTMARLRPNIVIDGVEANDEDHLDEIAFDTPDGPVRLKLVKPCTRCTIPDVDPDTGERGHAVGDALQAYRSDPRMDGAITFGMNAVIVEGIDRALKVGMAGRASYRF